MTETKMKTSEQVLNCVFDATNNVINNADADLLAACVADRNEVLFRGCVEWTENEDSLKTLIAPVTNAGAIGEGEQVIITGGNGSPNTAITCTIANLVQLSGSDTLPLTARVCTMINSVDTIVLTDHGFTLGQAISFGTTVGGVTAGTTYYVVAVVSSNTFQFSDSRGGDPVEATADVANTVIVASEYSILVDDFTIPAAAAATTSSPAAGVESVVVTGWPNGLGGALIFAKTDPSVDACAVFVEVRRA